MLAGPRPRFRVVVKGSTHTIDFHPAMVHLLATWIGVIFPTAQTYHPLVTTMAPRLEANAVIVRNTSLETRLLYRMGS
jgi:hypothetical protein